MVFLVFVYFCNSVIKLWPASRGKALSFVKYNLKLIKPVGRVCV